MLYPSSLSVHSSLSLSNLWCLFCHFLPGIRNSCGHPANQDILRYRRRKVSNTVAAMSSGGQLARNRALSLGSGRSSKGRNASMADFSMPDSKIARDFEPCDATASMFLYAQGNTVVCAHHDTLTIERRFSRHKEEVQILAVDNVSERGAGRLVISYDAGQTAIVWDLMTGDEVARFASYNTLSVAAWMRNGNVAFGECSRCHDARSVANFRQEMRKEM